MIDIKKEFSLKSFSFPLKSRWNLTYYKTLEQNLGFFEKKIENLSDSSEIKQRLKLELPNIKKSNEQILKIITSYLQGKSGKAYDILEELLESTFYRDRILTLVEKDSSFSDGSSRLIRIRSSLNQLTSREEMFHIPFSKRHLVANQRFSIAGLPCLYLGSSIYVCWLELERVDFGQLWISGYRSLKKFKLLNLAYDLNILIKQYENGKIDTELFINYFFLWPIVMACNYQVKYPGSPFHEEYIIPSLLLQWIIFGDLNKNIAGLKYLSTKLEKYDDPNFGINYVFPPINITEKYDFCPILKNQFKLSKPLSWELMSILPPVDVCAHGSGIVADNIEEALLKNYSISRFGYIEEQVFSMLFDKIKNPKLIV